MYTDGESELVAFRHVYWRYKKMIVVALVDERASRGLRKKAEGHTGYRKWKC